jgi:activator of HSP90 ATPase
MCPAKDLQAMTVFAIMGPNKEDTHMPEAIRVSAVIPCKRIVVYNAWLDGRTHSAFTGAKARIANRVGGRFSAWDSYIRGTTVKLVRGKTIVQQWRTTDFPEGSPDSKLVVSLDDARTGTRISLSHSNIPNGQGENYKRGWRNFYFAPMKRYFATLRKQSGKSKRRTK